MITSDEAQQIQGAFLSNPEVYPGARLVAQSPDEVADRISEALQAFRDHDRRAELILIPWGLARLLYRPTQEVYDHRIEPPARDILGIQLVRVECFLWGYCMIFQGVDVLATYFTDQVLVSTERFPGAWAPHSLVSILLPFLTGDP